MIMLLSPCYLEKKGKFYCDDQDLPVYMWTNSKTQFSVEELARLLLIESTVPQSKICSKQPVRVSMSLLWWIYMHWMIQKTSELMNMEYGNVMVLLLRMLASMGILLMLKYFVARIWAFTHIIIKFHIPTIATPAHLISGVLLLFIVNLVHAVVCE